MTTERFRKLRETAEYQIHAEEDGGFAAGDGPSYDADEIVAALDALEAVQEWAVQLQRNRDHENEFMVMAAVEVDRLIDRKLSGEPDE